ncbi:MAG: sortase [Patescibacteria group bacterium]|nr:sortase [Patescibacteria group bacterium]MCL5432294.1 sortase [Patescibacteria group bacterium]
MTIGSDFIKIFVLRTVGNFLLLSAIAGVILTFSPAIQAEVVYRYDNLAGKQFVVVDTPQQRANLLAVAPNTLPITPVDLDFGVVIPKINANAKVIPNVDPGNETEYLAALKQGVAQARGTVNPGQVGDVFLFAHSVGNFWEVNRWNAVFYLLRELAPGDEVDLFYQGRRFIYVVYDKKIVPPDATGYLTAQANFSMLTLQTCWPPGTTLERLLVFARLKTS